jgi:hypothetical protein
MNLTSQHLTENDISTFTELLEKINHADFFNITIEKDRVSFLGSLNRATIDNIKENIKGQKLYNPFIKFEVNQETNFVETEFKYGTIKVKITLT